MLKKTITTVLKILRKHLYIVLKIYYYSLDQGSEDFKK